MVGIVRTALLADRDDVLGTGLEVEGSAARQGCQPVDRARTTDPFPTTAR